MLKKLLLGLVLIIALVVAWFHAVGSGWFGEEWQSAPVTSGPRPTPAPADTTPQILFGDLHTHTNYSIDAYLFNMELVKGTGIVTPADACDFARYCSALDFWSINDHAEGMTPRTWSDTVNSIRECNAQAGEPDNPDMVSFVGWEWSNSDSDNVPSHYGHKNVIFRTWEKGQTPTRPIASSETYIMTKAPAALFGLLSLTDGIKAASDFGRYGSESKGTHLCPEGVAANELGNDCREVALTPRELYRKLDEWGFDSMVIPHGLAWGTTNPLTADFRDQLDQYELRYQKLLETFSGHGNSERFEDFERIAYTEDGEAYCPEATENFTPCCQQAAVIAQSRCADPQAQACAMEVADVVSAFVAKGAPRGRSLFPDASLDDWAGCGQLRNTFQPASMYVPRMSTQYNLALGFDAEGKPRRAKFGLIGSSDNHQARPGSSYKENNRVMYTDNKDVGRRPLFSISADKESGGFYYTGGLVAVHSEGRHRDAIWRGLEQRQVYATSGDRMLVWFDLLNGPEGVSNMGSETSMSATPRFQVRALGAFEQQPGCPDYAIAALGQQRMQSLCGGECYRAGDQRKGIRRIEIVRIQPQVHPDEDIAPLIQDQWRVFDCPTDGTGCTVEFEDPEYTQNDRPTLYYARVIQQAEELIGGDPFGCEFDDQGICVKHHYCIGEYASRDNNCTAPAEPRAWTSPIYLDFPAGRLLAEQESVRVGLPTLLH
jgi:hypothetical protein